MATLPPFKSAGFWGIHQGGRAIFRDQFLLLADCPAELDPLGRSAPTLQARGARSTPPRGA
eukprot:13025510-Heterocapsa_arctica.AAC.1